MSEKTKELIGLIHQYPDVNLVSNTKKCSLCEKEYTAILPNCPNCLCPANNKVVSNTDKLQEIKQRWDEGRGLISTDAIEFLISQLEQAQGEIQHSKKLHFESAQLLTGQMLKIELLEKENEQLKADKKKLVDGVTTLYNVAASNFANEEGDKSNSIMKVARKVLSEVKGNG